MISRRTGQIVLVNNIQAKFGIPFRTACKSLRQKKKKKKRCPCCMFCVRQALLSLDYARDHMR